MKSVHLEGRYTIRRTKDAMGTTGGVWLHAIFPEDGNYIEGEVRVGACVAVGGLSTWVRTTPVSEIISVEDKRDRRIVKFKTRNSTYLLMGSRGEAYEQRTASKSQAD